MPCSRSSNTRARRWDRESGRVRVNMGDLHAGSLLSKNGGTEALAKRIPPRTMGFPRDAVSGRSRSSPSAVQDPRGPTPGSGGPRPIPEGSPANPREPRKRSWTGVVAAHLSHFENRVAFADPDVVVPLGSNSLLAACKRPF